LSDVGGEVGTCKRFDARPGDPDDRPGEGKSVGQTRAGDSDADAPL
jgi:hypothetical protein